MTHLTYAEAMLVGLVQGVTELFPVSSLGHNVLIPALIGGSWAQDLNVSRPESPYLAFIVGLHVATAIAMIIYFRRDWVRITGGLLSSLRRPPGHWPRSGSSCLIAGLGSARLPASPVSLIYRNARRSRRPFPAVSTQ